jgi:hypothetical protein
MDRKVLLKSATRLDGRKLLGLFAVVVATILIDSEVGVVSDFIPEKSLQVQEYRSLFVLQ